MKIRISAGTVLLFLAAGCVSRPLSTMPERPASSGSMKTSVLDNSRSPDKLTSDLKFAEHCYHNGDYSRASAVAKSVCTRSSPGSSTHESARLLAAWTMKRSGNLAGAMEMLLPTPLPPQNDAHRARLALAADWRAETGDYRNAVNLMRAALASHGEKRKTFPWEPEARRKLTDWEQRSRQTVTPGTSETGRRKR